MWTPRRGRVWPVDGVDAFLAEHSVAQEADYKSVHEALLNGLLWSYCCSLLPSCERQANYIAGSLGTSTFKAEWGDEGIAAASDLTHRDGPVDRVSECSEAWQHVDASSKAGVCSLRSCLSKGDCRQNSRVSFCIVGGGHTCPEDGMSSHVKDPEILLSEGGLSPQGDGYGSSCALGDSMPDGKSMLEAQAETRWLFESAVESSTLPRTLSLELHSLLELPAAGSASELRVILNRAQAPWFDFWRYSVQGLELPSLVRRHLSWSPPPVRVPGAFCLFVDGSCDCHCGADAGWGAVLSAWDGLTWHYVGWAGGKCVGEGGETNNHAEASALLVVATWALAVPVGVPIWVYSDSKWALDCALGLSCAQTCGQGHAAAFLRYVMQLHESRRSSLVLDWTRGHNGIWGNEFADAIAKACGRGRVSPSPVPVAAQELWSHELLPWLWLSIGEHLDLPALDSLCTGQYEPQEVPTVACAEAILADVSKSHAHCSVESPVLRVGTANVCTLRNKEACLRLQVREHMIRVWAMQETRRKSESVVCDDGWVEVYSAGAGGQLGCALWFDLDGLACDIGCDRLRADVVTVLHASPDLLVVRLSAGRLDVVLVSMHGPHSLKPPVLIRKWWHDVKTLLTTFRKLAPLVLLGDHNATVGKGPQAVAGDLASDESDLAGELLVDLACDWGLAVVDTFPCKAFEVMAPRTWRNKSLDHILIDQSWLAGACLLEHTIDLCNRHEDHEAMVAQISFPRTVLAPGKRSGSRRASPPSTRSHARPTWDTNVHEHAEVLFAGAKAKRKPLQDFRPLKPYVSDASWLLICEKRQARRSVEEARRCLGWAVLQGCLRGWQSVSGGARPCDLGYASFDWERAGRRYVSLFKRIVAKQVLAKSLHSMIKHDKLTYIARLAEGAVEAAGRNDVKAMFHALRFFRGNSKRKGPRPLPLLLDSDGSHAVTFEAQQRVKAKHFGDMEAAVRVSPSECVALARSATTEDEDVPFALSELPTLRQLELGLRRLPRHKVSGPSGVPNEYWLVDTRQSARDWLPVLLKSHVRRTEPLRMAVGTLHCLYKGVGVMADISNHRSIFILEGIGKCFRKLLRPDLVRHVKSQTDEVFHGCVPGSYSTALSHYVVTWLGVCRARKTCCGLLFMDLKAAYYRVLRSRLLGMEWSDAAVCDVLKQMGVSSSLWHEVTAWSGGGCLLSGLSAHARQVIRSMFAVSAFVAPGLTDFYCSRSGTRPGDSVADVLFAVVFADALGSVKKRLGELGLLEGPTERLESRLPVWADDLTVPFTSAEAVDFVDRASCVCRVLHEECSRRALEPNYKRGKTECLVWLGGTGSKAVESCLFHQLQGIPFQSGGCTHHVRVVRRYVHLGTLVTAGGNATPDLKVKLARANGYLRPLARKVLRRPDLEMRHKRGIYKVLGASVAEYNLAIWGPLNKEALHAWTQGLDSLYRLLLIDDRHTGSPAYPSIFEVVGATQLPVPEGRLSALRLLHAQKLVHLEFDVLWTLLEEEDSLVEHSWFHCLRHDLAWLQYWSPDVGPVPGPESCAGELAVWFSERSVLRYVRRALNKQAASFQEWNAFQLEQRQCGAMCGVSCSLDLPRTVEESLCSCHECEAVFTSELQLMGHLAKVHGHRSPVWAFAGGTCCRACLTQFWSRKRLKAHLLAGSPCLAILVANVDGRQPPAAEADVPLHDEDLPAVRLAGPRFRVCSSQFEHVIAFAGGATPAERTVVVRSALALLKRISCQVEHAELYEAFLTALDTKVIRRGQTTHLPVNPDGRLFVQRCRDALSSM